MARMNLFARAVPAFVLACGLVLACDDNPAPEPEPPAAPDIVLSELLAANTATLADEFGEYDDWIELLNAGSEPAATGGLSLTDDLGQPLRFLLPDTTLSAGSVLLVWTDGQPEQGAWHAPFRLSAAGEEVGLFRLQGGSIPYALLDSVSFGAQGPDTSFARQSGGTWAADPTPTPGQPND